MQQLVIIFTFVIKVKHDSAEIFIIKQGQLTKCGLLFKSNLIVSPKIELH